MKKHTGERKSKRLIMKISQIPHTERTRNSILERENHTATHTFPSIHSEKSQG